MELRLSNIDLNGCDKDHLEEATKIKKLRKKYNSLFIVNDRVDIALIQMQMEYISDKMIRFENSRKITAFKNNWNKC